MQHAMDTFGKFRHIGKHHDDFFWHSAEGLGHDWLHLFFRRQRQKESTPTCSYSLLNLIEGHSADSVFLPIFVIEVPPFRLVDFETLRLHCIAQQVTVPTL